MSPTLPTAGGAPVLAIVQDGDSAIAIVAPEAAEGIPGPGWGLGERAPLVRGPAPALEKIQAIGSERLVTLSGGDARLIHIDDRLDGPATEFGRAFWKTLVQDAPLTMAAIGAHGISAAHYIDRYLLTPLNLRLLLQVLSALPQGRTLQRLTITTARLDRSQQPGWTVFHAFPEDAQRRTVIEALWPGAVVEIRPKTELPHARSLRLVLGDGRHVTLLLDQGFGAWRAEGAPRHNFHADPGAQARAIVSTNYGVRSGEGQGTPIILWEGSDEFSQYQ